VWPGGSFALWDEFVAENKKAGEGSRDQGVDSYRIYDSRMVTVEQVNSADPYEMNH